MSKGYSYIVSRDYGFAPNPFEKTCTLATCKPKIRKNGLVGDYVFGVSPKNKGHRLVYAMRVSEKMSFDQYWADTRFQNKKPVMNGTKITAYGDNIYHHDPQSGLWLQSDSHHSYPNGIINENNLNRDTGTTDQVLVSFDFYYFGSKMIELSDEFKLILARTKNGYLLKQGERELTEKQCSLIWGWVSDNHAMGMHGFPLEFSKKFKRYDGKS